MTKGPVPEARYITDLDKPIELDTRKWQVDLYTGGDTFKASIVWLDDTSLFVDGETGPGAFLLVQVLE